MNRWWLEDQHERYWVETLSERRPTLGTQLHAPQVDGSGRVNWRYSFVAETRDGDVVLHWLHTPREHGFVGWSVVDGKAESRPIEWQARGTYGRQRPADRSERPGWWVPLRDFSELRNPIGLTALKRGAKLLTRCSGRFPHDLARGGLIGRQGRNVGYRGPISPCRVTARLNRPKAESAGTLAPSAVERGAVGSNLLGCRVNELVAAIVLAVAGDE